MKFSLDKRFFRQYLIGPVFALATILLTLLLFDSSFMLDTIGTSVFPAIERRGFDMLMRSRGMRESANDVILISIDDYTDSQLNSRISHQDFGRAIAALSYYGAKAVALDMFLPENKALCWYCGAEQDSADNANMAALVATTDNFYPVIGPMIPYGVAKERISRQDVDSTAFYSIGKFGYPMPRRHHFFRAPLVNDYPFPELTAVSAGVGHAVLIPDSLDGVIRSIPLFIEYAGKLYPSLGLALALHVRGIHPNDLRYIYTEDGMVITAKDLTMKTGLWGEMAINYIGSGKEFPSVSFIDILFAVRDRNEKFFEQFRNKVCIIGPTIRSVGDYYSTPVDDSSPGYITHANIYDMFATGNFLYTAPSWASMLLLILTTLIVGFVAHAQHMRTGVIILFAVILATAAFAYVSFGSFNLWFPIVQTMFSMVFCFIATVAYRAATEGHQRKIVTEMFGRYVDSTVVRSLVNDPSLVKLGGEKRELTLLFTDIKGFSTISEKVDDETLVKLLNLYLTEMTAVILKHKGTVDKFIGDAIMAFWGAPLRDPEAPMNACRAALEMQERLKQLQPKFQKIADTELIQRVGLNTGLCTVGNMGSNMKINYTAVGDPVNLASRLEGANKQFGTDILISEYTFQKLMKRVVTREVDRVIVAGKTEPVRIYELLDSADRPLSDKTKSFLDVYAEGLKAYQERRWDEGIAMMEHAMTFLPNDPVCQLYVERMKLYKLTPPGKDWKGVFVLHSK